MQYKSIPVKYEQQRRQLRWPQKKTDNKTTSKSNKYLLMWFVDLAKIDNNKNNNNSSSKWLEWRNDEFFVYYYHFYTYTQFSLHMMSTRVKTNQITLTSTATAAAASTHHHTHHHHHHHQVDTRSSSSGGGGVAAGTTGSLGSLVNLGWLNHVFFFFTSFFSSYF